MSENIEDLIDIIEDMGTDEIRIVFEGLLGHIAGVRKAGLQNAYAGVKVPIDGKARTVMARSLTDAFQEWAKK